MSVVFSRILLQKWSMAPTRCLEGFYCPNGTATPLPCPDSNNKDKAYYGCPGLINLVGVYMRKKHPGYSPVNLVPRLAGMILILIYMKSFVPFTGMKVSRGTVLNLVQSDLSYSSAIITLNLVFILGLSASRSNSIKATCDL